MSQDDEREAFAATQFRPSTGPEATEPTLAATSVRPSIQRALPSIVPEPGAAIGRFVLERKLGEGGMGMVFEAQDPDLQRRVALKLLRPGEAGSHATESQQRMLREAQAMAMLQHPNLVTIYEVGTHEDDVFLAMEYVIGQTMEDWLAAGPALEDKLEVFEQAARALQAVHDAGLVHRDFKPENVMVMEDGTAKVLDLGIARRIVPDDVEELAEEVERKRDSTEDARAGLQAHSDAHALESITGSDAFKSQLTQQGAIIGTPSYMAPEQLLGREAGPAADQFAFAIALYEAVTGDRPFGGVNMIEMMANVVANERKPWPEDCEAPQKLQDAIDRALSPEPTDRFASMTEFFEACREGLGLRAQIRFLTARWKNHGKHHEYLLPQGDLLQEGLDLLARHPEALSADQAELVEHSWAAVRRRMRARKAATIGIVLLVLALLPALWLAERRSVQLREATIAGIGAHIAAVGVEVTGSFEQDREDILLMFDQRGVWAPVAEQLFAPEAEELAEAEEASGADEASKSEGAEEAAPQAPQVPVEASLRAGVRGLNAFFQPVVERADTISSLMVARDDEGEYLVFEDPDAQRLDPPYRVYNRVIHKPRFADRAYQSFFAPSGERSWESWLGLGEADSRGQPWTGYTPSARPWFANAAARSGAEVSWTEPYLFFVSKDAGVTGSIAFQQGGHRYVLAVDFMLTDLSRITALSEVKDYISFVASRTGALVALPQDPRFETLEDVREFYVEFDRGRRVASAEGTTADAAARLPQVADLGRPLLQAAFQAAPDEGRRVFSFQHDGEQRWAGRAPVGDAGRGLTLYVVKAAP